MSDWKLVPVEPTKAMIQNGKYAWEDCDTHHMGNAYKAMLAAAPQQPVDPRIAELEAAASLWKANWNAACDDIAELEAVIARNCDPTDADQSDAQIIYECFEKLHPENFDKGEQE